MLYPEEDMISYFQQLILQLTCISHLLMVGHGSLKKENMENAHGHMK